MERLASLISGGGTTMEQIVRASQNGHIPSLAIACIVASTPEAGGIARARTLGIPAKDIVVVNPRDFRTSEHTIDRTAFGECLLSVLRDHGATVVTQNGWLPLTPRSVIQAYRGKIFNQHPGPPEDFGGKGMYGLNVHAAVLQFYRMVGRIMSGAWTEIVAHHVDEGVDTGQVVRAAPIAIRPEDSPEELQQRALPIEHMLQIQLLRDIVRGTVREVTGRTRIVQRGEDDACARAKRLVIDASSQNSAGYRS